MTAQPDPHLTELAGAYTDLAALVVAAADVVAFVSERNLAKRPGSRTYRHSMYVSRRDLLRLVAVLDDIDPEAISRARESRS